MTILSSKKPTGNSKDPSSNNSNQQQPQSTSALTISRARLSRDDDGSVSNSSNVTGVPGSPGNLIEESTLRCDNSTASSSSTTGVPIGVGSLPMITTAPMSSHLGSNLSNGSKRKSPYPHQRHYHHHHSHQTMVKQARRRRGSTGDKIAGTVAAAAAAAAAAASTTSPSSSSPTENSMTPSSSSNELPTTVACASSSLTTVSNRPSSGTDEAGQCNSEDEYEQAPLKYDRNNLDELEMRFVRALKEQKGFVIRPIKEDGACLFRAVSDQVFGDEEMHATVRQNCMDYIVKNADFFRAYITEDFDHYVTRKRRQNCHGNHIEMIALSELYNRPIEVYEYSMEPINTVHGMFKTDNEPIRLSYHCSIHYNSIIDPWRPTAGVGLGLPDLEPGRAQNALIVKALRQSEESHIERAMLDDKLAATDWEATQEELIQQVARESYLEWLCESNQQHKDNKSMSSASSSSTSATTSDRISNGNDACSPKNLLPLRLDERKDCEFALPFHYEGDASSNPDDDDSLMRQVLAISRIEYVETLKKQQQQNDPDGPSSSSDTHLL